MKLVFLDAKTLGKDISLDRFKKYGECRVYENSLSKREILERLSDADIVITNKVIIDKEVMDSSQKLKLICVAATGMNNIDLEYAKEKGVTVKNVANYSTPSVAQHTFTLLFYLIGQSRFYDELVKSGDWCESEMFTNLDKPFFEIKDKVWGIIGLGNIGKEVAKIASSFGAKVIYYSTSGKNSNKKYKQVGLEELLKNSDIISIHAPLNRATYNLLGKNELQRLKEDAVLLNLGRGGIINESDLAKIIDEKKIYVGLDVLESEPMDKNSLLLKVKNRDKLFITPHIAWASKEARERLVKKIEENIKNFLGEQDG